MPETIHVKSIPRCKCDMCGESHRITETHRTIGVNSTETLCRQCYYETNLTTDEISELYQLLVIEGLNESNQEQISQILNRPYKENPTCVKNSQH